MTLIISPLFCQEEKTSQNAFSGTAVGTAASRPTKDARNAETGHRSGTQRQPWSGVHNLHDNMYDENRNFVLQVSTILAAGTVNL